MIAVIFKLPAIRPAFQRPGRLTRANRNLTRVERRKCLPGRGSGDSQALKQLAGRAACLRSLSGRGRPTTDCSGVTKGEAGEGEGSCEPRSVSGRIVVSADSEQVDICSVRRGCTKSLSAPYLDLVASVALSRNGDCWAEGDDTSGPGTLIYQRCAAARFPLRGNGTYGHLNKGSTEFAAANSQNSSIDIYKYSPT